MTNTEAILPYQERQTRLQQLLIENKLNALVLNPSPTLTYLTGLHFHLMERPIVGLFTPGQPVGIILPQLETAKLTHVQYPYRAFAYQEDPETWQASFNQAFERLGINGKTIGVEATGLRFLELEFIKKAADHSIIKNASHLIANLRSIKCENEINAMRKAAEIAQNALLATLPVIQPGKTEKEIAAELSAQLLKAGTDSQMPFAPIVSGGPNSANPHAVPSDRPLQTGDLLVIDWGARYQGYCSDITRTFAIGSIEDEFRKISEIVLQANRAARKVVKPGVSASTIDLAARNVIRNAGYGEYFIHRTGHGLGLEGHEAPYIRDDNHLPLETGITFTIEPGIYLPERGGVRIEDDILITPQGYESFSDLPREVRTLPLKQ